MLRGLVPESAFQGKFEKKRIFCQAKFSFTFSTKFRTTNFWGSGGGKFQCCNHTSPEPKNCLKFTTAFTWFTFEKPGRKRSHVEVSGLIVFTGQARAKSSLNVVREMSQVRNPAMINVTA